MQLTVEQVRELKVNGAAEIKVNGIECILVRKTQDRENDIDYDELTIEELRLLAIQTFADADEAEPIPEKPIY